MKYSSFKKPEYVRKPIAPPKPIGKPAQYGIPAVEHQSDAKELPLRSEPMKAFARTLRCQICNHPAPSEASHRNVGKGMGTKTSDLCAALCHTCHVSLDSKVGVGWNESDYRWLVAFYKTMEHYFKGI
jgi:transcription elongation factor Elf1